jgi:GNAT superfamily N-acetyltransferase
MSVVVRRPIVADADELARINIASWQDAYTGIIPWARINEMTLLTYRQRWIDRLSAAQPGVAYFMAEVHGQLAAYAGGGPYRVQEDAVVEDTTGLGELYAVYADPLMQQRGAGSAVHDALLEWLGDAGYTAAALWVLTANQRSRSWYARRGWQPDGASSTWTTHGKAHPEIRLRRSPSGS